MSKALATIGKVAGIVASVAMFIPGGQPIAAVASVVSAVATTAARLTAKAPPARGQVNDRVIGANNALPYLMGRSYSGGNEVHDVGYGGTVSKVANPYRFLPVVYSCAGPVEELEATQLEYETVAFSGDAATGYYAGFLYRDAQLGASPEASALAPQWGSAPGWGSDYKLSGFAAIGWSLKFDKKGKIFAQGLPSLGAIWKGVKVYDPRLDSTRPGGTGSHRIADESTWAYSDNPALHALAYAYGRYQNGAKIFGVDLGEDGIDILGVAAWANVCDANGWTLGGTIYEPGDKWANLKRICEAGACEPVMSGGLLHWHFETPRVALDTITAADLAGPPAPAQICQPWASRINTFVAKYRSEANQWGYVQATATPVAAFVAEDGETKREERQFDLVLDATQAVQMFLYDGYRRREAGPFIVPCKPRLRAYRPGDALTLAADCKLWPTDLLTIVRKRRVDPATHIVTLELVGETTAKHSAILGSSGAAPPAATLPTLAEKAAVYAQNSDPAGYGTTLIQTSYISGLGGNPLASADAGTGASISVAAHNRVYPDRTVAVDAASMGDAFPFGVARYVYYDDPGREGGAVSYVVTADASEAATSDANPDRHFVGSIVTATDGGSGTGGGGGLPPGWGGGGGGTAIP